MLFGFKSLSIWAQILKEMLFFSDSLQQLSVILLSVEEPGDELLGIANIGAAANLMVGWLNNVIVGDKPFHFVLEEFLEEEIGKANIKALLFFLQFFAHCSEHDLFDLSLPLFFTTDVIVLPIQCLMQWFYLSSTLCLLAHHCSLDRFQHISASVADLCLVELILP